MLIFTGLIFIIGISYLQSKLSAKTNKFLGLILPLISFIFSLLLISITYSCDGLSFINILGFVLTLVIYNISTIILLIIYYLSRKQITQNKELLKMHIQDLK